MNDVVSISQEEQFALLRDMTKRTGVLHEAQVLQLKHWPRLWFPLSTAATATVDVDKKTVSFEVLTPRYAPEDARSAEVLGRCVRWMFGDGWRVTVEVKVRGRKKSTKSQRYKV